MKNIKLRIVYLILGSALLLFAMFMLAVNLIIPAHFVREAKKALISEAQYQNRTIPYTDDESFFDDEWNDTEEHFLTPSIVFLELDNTNQSSSWNRDAYRLEKKLLEYCKGRDLSLNQCYTFKTDRHHLIFMSVQEEQDDWEKPYAYIMYIDIGPITRYIVTLNWAFFAVLLAISSVMCLLGFRFGRDIEKEAERQQTFFQNASHELKTPLMAIQGYAEGIQAGVMDAGGAAEVILAGSELFTGNCLFLLPLLRGDITGGRTMGSWAVVYCGNLIGSIVIAFVVVRCGVLDSIAPAAIATAAAKASLPIGTAFLRGVLCNLLVCLAVWMAFCAGSAGGKVISLYGPIFLFVLCGFEHSIANMFYLPAGILLSGGAEVTWLDFLRNLGPVTLGNMAGGCGLGVILYMLYGKSSQ